MAMSNQQASWSATCITHRTCTALMFDSSFRPTVLQGCIAEPIFVNPELPNLDSTRLISISDGVTACTGAPSSLTSSSQDSSAATVNFKLDANTVDVRGKATDEALAQVEAALDSVAQSALFVVHGVGTGKLRSEVHQFLQHNAQVAKFSLEKESSGGCTVVHLK